MPILSCSSSSARAVRGSVEFLHGVASGDPRDASVVLWTRVTPLEDTRGFINLRLQVALSEDFAELINDVTVKVDESSDYTARFLVTKLDSDTIYFYRFIANESVHSMVGRTWTAPKKDDSVEICFASANCQNREHGFYAAFQTMLQEDLVKQREHQIRFVLHLGDFIYETRDDGLQYPVDDLGNRLASLYDTNGVARTVGPFPHGGSLPDGSEYAKTLQDYRHLYKTYLLDPQLQAARARWPFLHVWDDHEFSDDSWQSEANYDDIGLASTYDEPSQARKVAANQAWYEYLPVDYREDSNLGEVPHHANEFRATKVSLSTNDEFDEYGLASNSDNLAAIDSLTIFRSLCFGRNLQLVLTDCRSYRSDHPLPEDISGNFPGFVHSRLALPISLINTLDAGKDANQSDPPEFLDLPFLLRNPNTNRSPGTMLGNEQKNWWKAVMSESQAQWKVLGNSVPLMRFGIDLSNLSLDLDDIVLSSDTWDGYNTERRELLDHLYKNNITNVVSIAGDVHAFYAGEVINDYDDAEQQREFSLPEFVCGATSSISQFQALERLSYREEPDEIERALRQLIVYFDDETGEALNNFNTTMLFGVDAARDIAESADLSNIVNELRGSLNSHLTYADTNEHGYGIFCAGSQNFQSEFVIVKSIQTDPQSEVPQVLRRVFYQVDAQGVVGPAKLSGPEFEGKMPFPFENSSS